MVKKVRAARWVAIAAMLCAFAALQPASAGIYLGGGTVVYKQEGQAPEADRGVTICHTDSGIGIGGGCLPFTNPDFGAIQVDDVLHGSDVAFQVCIDNNGDSKCSSGGDRGSEPCADFVAFSHDDKGNFFNPLGPLPASRTPGCNPGQTGWDGYVVFLCEGVHSTRDAVGSHSHPATTGSISNADPFLSSGYGDFCGGTRELVVEKDYVLAP